jgi:guanyl-specific ribonuclease Sa
MKLKFKKTLLYVALLMALVLSLVGCSRKPKVVEPETGAGAETSVEASNTVSGVASAQELSTVEDGTYTSKEDVALYIHIYGKLPSNFITKKEAKKLGWPGGSLEDYAPGKSIGGDYFGNYEGLLPTKEGRKYYECDIDTLGKSKRGAKRIIYSNDGLIFYTEDHYESFDLLYGEP